MGTFKIRHYYDTPIPAPEPEPFREKKARIARINAAKSTGPKTEEGKRKSSQNARKHGLTATVLLVDEEDRQRFEDLREGLMDSFRAEGVAEVLLVEDIAETVWKMRMAGNIETDALRDNLEQGQTIHEAFTFDSETIMRISTYQARLHRQFHKLIDQLRNIQKDALDPRRNPVSHRPLGRPAPHPAADPWWSDPADAFHLHEPAAETDHPHEPEADNPTAHDADDPTAHCELRTTHFCKNEPTDGAAAEPMSQAGETPADNPTAHCAPPTAHNADNPTAHSALRTAHFFKNEPTDDDAAEPTSQTGETPAPGSPSPLRKSKADKRKPEVPRRKPEVKASRVPPSGTGKVAAKPGRPPRVAAARNR